MTKSNTPWVDWANALTAIAQNGITYSDNPFDQERYHKLQTIAKSMLENHSDIDNTLVEKLLVNEEGYFTPKIDVRALVLKNRQVLLVQERQDQKWALPGGWADVNVSPSENAVKEVFEESGFKTRATKLLAMWDKQKHDHPPHWPHTYKCFFLCELLGGAATPSIETSDVRFFDLGELPPLSTHRITAKQIKELVRLAEHNEYTAFD